MPSSILSESKSSETQHQPFNAIGIFSFFSTVLALLGLSISGFSIYQLALAGEQMNIAMAIQTVFILLVSCCWWAFARVIVGMATKLGDLNIVRR